MRKQITLLVVLTLLLTSLAGCSSSTIDDSLETTDSIEIEKVADKVVEEEPAEVEDYGEYAPEAYGADDYEGPLCNPIPTTNQ